jgi:HEAT repeat protein
MKNLIFLFIIFISKEEKLKIEEILKAVSLKIEDLSYDKLWIEEKDFMLKIFKKIMKEPLYFPEYLNETNKTLQENSENSIYIIKYFLKQIDIKEEKINLKFDEKIELIDFQDEDLKNLFEEYLFLIKEYKNFLKKCLQLSEKEFDSFLVYSPLFFEDPDYKSDDTLKGILHREKKILQDTSFKFEEKEIFKKIKKIDYEKILNYQFKVLKTIEKIILFSKKIYESGIDYKKIVETPYGKIALNFKEEDNFYDENYVLIIDGKGNDKYKNIGRGIGVLGFNPFEIVIDFEGNDYYICEKIFGIGGGFFGIGGIFDFKGDDFYKGNYYSIGCGFFGIGILIDKQGNDIYEGGVFSEGAGFFGIGIVFDFEGNDIYRIWNYGQGLGSVKGYGILYDKKGNDSYIAYGKFIHHPLLPDETRSFAQGFSIGFRPFASGGIGVLIDEEGNDYYVVEVYGQGTSYFYGIGMLLDKKGNDLYSASEYAQGCGIHLSAGILVDLEGDDDYISKFGPAQGEGHDLSVGILIDKKGDDSYKVSGGQGIGLTNSVGIFIDADGNDIYNTYEKEIGQGSGTWIRGFCGIGIFVDLKGKDIYPREIDDKNISIWIKGKYGVGYDVDSSKVLYPEKEGKDTLLSDTTNIKKLFEIASLWEVGENKIKVKKAREILSNKKEEALKFIFEKKINTINSLELRAIVEVVKNNKEIAKEYILKNLNCENDTIRRNVIYLAGEAEVEGTSQEIGNLLKKEKNERVKRMIIYSLWKLKNKNFIKEIKECFKTKNEPLKISVCEYFQNIKDTSSISFLIDVIKKEIGVIRYAAESALIYQGKEGEEKIIYALKNEKDPIIISHFLRILSKISNSITTKKILLEYLDSPFWFLRGIAVNGLGKFKEEGIKEILKTKILTEENVFVRREIEKIIKN